MVFHQGELSLSLSCSCLGASSRVSLSHLSGGLCAPSGTAEGVRTSRGTLEGKRRHRLAYRQRRGVIEIQRLRWRMSDSGARLMSVSFFCFPHMRSSGFNASSQLKGSAHTAKNVHLGMTEPPHVSSVEISGFKNCCNVLKGAQSSHHAGEISCLRWG